MELIESRGEKVDELLILDGGLATELVEDGFVIDNDPLWSARVLCTSPEAIKRVHKKFLEAGSDVIITSSYQTSLSTLEQYNSCSEAEAIDYIKSTVSLAKDACSEFWDTASRDQQRKYPLIAGSVGPFGACQNDCSEYHGRYVDEMSIEELIEWHRPRLRLLVESGVDLIAVETIPALKEALAVATLLKEFSSTKAWVTFSCQDGARLCHGEKFADAVSALSSFDQIIGVGVNCTPPEYVESLLCSIGGAASDKIKVVYPNSGEAYENGEWVAGKNKKNIADFASSWYKAGAKWIGGCCRTTPNDITALRQLLKP